MTGTDEDTLGSVARAASETGPESLMGLRGDSVYSKHHDPLQIDGGDRCGACCNAGGIPATVFSVWEPGLGITGACNSGIPPGDVMIGGAGSGCATLLTVRAVRGQL